MIKRIGKVIFVIVGSIVGTIALFLGFTWYDVLHSDYQKRRLQSRSDYAQIAAACASLPRSITGWSVEPSDPRVPPIVRSLSPRYILLRSNAVTLEFHGTVDHYGYRVEQSELDTNLWTISYYAEHETKSLTTITNK